MKALLAAVFLVAASSSIADEYVTVYVPDGMKLVLVPKDTPKHITVIKKVRTVEPTTDSPSEECGDTLSLGPGDPCSQ
jgi:hypothetical protein